MHDFKVEDKVQFSHEARERVHYCNPTFENIVPLTRDIKGYITSIENYIDVNTKKAVIGLRVKWNFCTFSTTECEEYPTEWLKLAPAKYEAVLHKQAEMVIR